MADLICQSCGATASYAGADQADAARSCGDDLSVTRHTACGPVYDGEKHNWTEA